MAANNKAKETLDESLARLVDGVTGVVDSAEFKAWLKTAALFHRYSFGNQWLIAIQRPTATRVAGFKTWLKVKRAVKKGEKGIMILVPMKGRPTEDKETGEVKEGRMFFGTGYVFDVEQTDGEPLPELGYVHTDGDGFGHLFDAATTLAMSMGLRVDVSTNDRGTGASGFYDKASKLIWVSEKSSVDGRTSTILHELAHAFDATLHDGDDDGLVLDYRQHRGERETVAEAAAYIAASHFGFETGQETFTYIATWAKDIKVLKARLSEVQKIARSIIDGMESSLAKAGLMGEELAEVTHE